MRRLILTLVLCLAIAGCNANETPTEAPTPDSAPDVEEAAPEPVPEEPELSGNDCGASAILDMDDPDPTGDAALACFGRRILACEPASVALSYEGETQLTEVVLLDEGCAIKSNAEDGTFLQCPVPMPDEEVPPDASDDEYAMAALGYIMMQPFLVMDPESGCIQG